MIENGIKIYTILNGGIKLKSIKYIAGALVLSFILNVTGVLAFSSDIVNFAGYKIPGWKNATKVSNKKKSDYSSQVINIIGTSYNRDIQFQIDDNNTGATSGYQTLYVGNGQVTYAIGREGITTGALSISALMAGTKTLNLRTANNWLASETSYSGAWWLSLNDWEQMYGKANISGDGFVSKLQ